MRSPRLKPKPSPNYKLFRWFLLILLMVAVPLLTLPMVARFYLSQGDRLLAEKQIPEAITAYSTALRFQSNFATIYLRLGKALQENQEYSEALVAYNRALLVNPNLTVKPELAFDLNSLGTQLDKQGNLLEAITAYQKAIKIDPFLVDAYNNLGEALTKQEKWQEASKIFNQVIQIDPENAHAYSNLGKIFSKQEQWEQANQAYQRAIELKPDDASIYQNFAKVLVKQKQFATAEQTYLQAITFAPQRGDLYNGLGEVLYEQKRIDEAIAAYQQALKLSPNNAEIYKNFCYARHTQQKYEEALKLCRQAIALDNTQGGAKFYVAEVERGLAVHKNPKLLQMPEHLPSQKSDPLVNLKRSVVKIILKSPTYQGIGTGWIFKRQGNKAWIVTNRHVLTNPDEKQDPKTRIAVEFYSQPPKGQFRKRRPAKIIQQTSADDWVDLAVLEVTDIPQDIKPLSLSSIPPFPATKVQVIGHPITANDWSVASGEVQSSTDQDLYLSIALASGNSGGPVLNPENQVIGLVVKAGLFCPQAAGTDQIDLSFNQLGCGVAFPIQLIKQRLKNWGI